MKKKFWLDFLFLPAINASAFSSIKIRSRYIIRLFTQRKVTQVSQYQMLRRKEGKLKEMTLTFLKRLLFKEDLKISPVLVNGS